MGIIIGADLVPTASNKQQFINGDVEELFDDKILKTLKSAQMRIFNLETVLSSSETTIAKIGPNFKTNPEVVRGFKQLDIDIFTLANNHIMDYGAAGLKYTIDILEKNDIAYVGIGHDISTVNHSYIFEVCEKKVGIYACAEHEFSIATENTPGANPYDPLESFEHIADLKNRCDYVIVLYHGGKEYYRYPSPLLQKVCRKMCTSGADLVVCQHSHCIGCEEKYNDSTIIYGQGNFLFDISDDEFFTSSLLIDIEIESDIPKVNYIPIVKNKNGIRKANESESQKIMSMFYERSVKIQDADFIKKEYEKFASRMLDGYIDGVFGTNIFFRILNKLSGHRLTRHINNKKALFLRNYIECEAHSEIFLVALKNLK